MRHILHLILILIISNSSFSSNTSSSQGYDISSIINALSHVIKNPELINELPLELRERLAPLLEVRLTPPEKEKRNIMPALHYSISFKIKNALPPETTDPTAVNIKANRSMRYVHENHSFNHHKHHAELYKSKSYCNRFETVGDPERDERKLVLRNGSGLCSCDVAHTGISNICGKLIIRFPDKTVSGTGFLIGPHHVLTAAHCLYNTQHGCYAQEVTFQYFDLINKENERNGDHCFIVSGWHKERDSKCDYGVLVLNGAPIERCGFMGIEYHEDDNLKDTYINIMGYPTSPPLPDKIPGIYTAWGIIKRVENDLIKHNVDTSPGQSGSSIWTLKGNETQPYALGIHTEGYDSDEEKKENKVNKGVKISSIHYQNILDWIDVP